MKAHPTAFVDPSAIIGEDVEVGPFCFVGPGVTLGDGCVLMAHVHIGGPATIGRNNVFYPTAAIGGPPQTAHPPEKTGPVEIGDDNIFRESCTVNLPKGADGVTRVGSRNRFHYCTHIAHDCVVENDCIFDSGFGIIGHALVHSGARGGPGGGVHQFVTVGRNARLLPLSGCAVDIPPFLQVLGNHAQVTGLHKAGVRHLPEDRLRALQEAYELVYESGLPRSEALAQLEENDPTPEVSEIIEFIRRTMQGRMGRALEAFR